MSNDSAELVRCGWCGSDALYCRYHDEIWGRPVSDDRELFEKLCLDGQQEGLSWITILRKQQSYRQAYSDFDPAVLATWGAAQVEQLMQNPGIVRNRLKVESILRNARAYETMREQGESFSRFLWSFVDGQPLQNRWRTLDELPANTRISDAMSKALKKKGFNFVGTTICYAFMQAVGMVNDHLVDCHAHEPCREAAASFSLAG